eukprot:scaffold333_cov133-Cylindrotheca_fusiformis.AAC.35
MVNVAKYKRFGRIHRGIPVDASHNRYRLLRPKVAGIDCQFGLVLAKICSIDMAMSATDKMELMEDAGKHRRFRTSNRKVLDRPAPFKIVLHVSNIVDIFVWVREETL